MRSSWGVQSLGCLLPLSLHPVSQGRVLNLAKTTGLDFSLGLFFWLTFSGLQGGVPGQLLGVAAASSGWTPTGAGLWSNRSINAGANPWAHHPGWTHRPFIFPWCWWCELELGDGEGGASDPPPGEHTGYHLCACGLAANFSDWK